jgi:hypothetical protein
MSTFISRRKQVWNALANQAGHTLAELVLVVGMMTMVLALPLGFQQVFTADQQRVESGARTLIDQRTGVEGITREVRQAISVCQSWPTCGTFAASSSVDIQRCTAWGASGCSTTTWVRYDCTGGTPQTGPSALTTRACLRSEAASPTQLGQNARVVIGNLAVSQPAIFTFTNPKYVGISMQVMSKGRNTPVALSDGVELRNID